MVRTSSNPAILFVTLLNVTDLLMVTHNCDGVELGAGFRLGVGIGLGW